MANQKHLEIITQGVEAWNQWRDEEPEIIPDLIHANLAGAKLRLVNLRRAELFGLELSGADLFGADLSGANLSEANLRDAKLRGADIRDSDLSRAVLRQADLKDARIARANLSYAELQGAKLRHADLSNTNLRGANLSHVDLRGAVLKNANLSYTDISNADLRSAILSGANLRGSDIGGADLSGVNLSKSDLLGANFRGSDLSGANLTEVDLSRANLRGARLNVSNLRGAKLSGANLEYADLSGADLVFADLHEVQVGFTMFGNVDLDASRVHGLETVIHTGPSTIGVDTIYLSKGNIPEVFLKEAGVPDDFIAYVASINGQTIQFDSCFISYSHKDEKFSKKLCLRLRESHVRVWFAPEDIRGGEKLNVQISLAIQLYGRILIVLSQNSLQSEWVIEEIRKAKRAESKDGRRKLFPIRLVDFETIKAWRCFDADSGKDLAVEVREYFIPDFSNWTDEGAFAIAFARLIRDLRAEDSS